MARIRSWLKEFPIFMVRNLWKMVWCQNQLLLRTVKSTRVIQICCFSWEKDINLKSKIHLKITVKSLIFESSFCSSFMLFLSLASFIFVFEIFFLVLPSFYPSLTLRKLLFAYWFERNLRDNTLKHKWNCLKLYSAKEWLTRNLRNRMPKIPWSNFCMIYNCLNSLMINPQ